jgi:hypothetical protein
VIRVFFLTSEEENSEMDLLACSLNREDMVPVVRYLDAEKENSGLSEFKSTSGYLEHHQGQGAAPLPMPASQPEMTLRC